MSKILEIVREQALKHRFHGDPRGSRRILAKRPRVVYPHTTGPTMEDAPAMSVGAGDPAKVTNPSDNYSLQRNRSRFLRAATAALRRRKPV